MVRKNSASLVSPAVYYPDSDGKPMGETPLHVQNFRWLVELLDAWFAQALRVFVAGNMFVYYEQGNPRRHVSPDVFVVRGIPKVVDPPRRRYLLWENKAIDFVIELTSDSTRREDTEVKMAIYRDIIGVKEYFLFDPYEEHLHPPLQGYRLSRGRYVPIRAINGRLPSKVTGLHLEVVGELLRLYDPETEAWLLTPPEEREARLQAEQERTRAELAQALTEQERVRAELARAATEQENERLRRQIEALRRQLDEQQQ